MPIRMPGGKRLSLRSEYPVVFKVPKICTREVADMPSLSVHARKALALRREGWR